MRTRGGIRSRDESELDQAEASLPEKRPLSAECLNPNMRQGYVQRLLHSAVRMQPWQRSSWHARRRSSRPLWLRQSAPKAQSNCCLGFSFCPCPHKGTRNHPSLPSPLLTLPCLVALLYNSVLHCHSSQLQSRSSRMDHGSWMELA
jgi:hypothetical protein